MTLIAIFHMQNLQQQLLVRQLTVRQKLEGLESNTVYYHRVWFSTLNSGDGNDKFDVSNPLTGSFRAALDRATSKQIDFVISGDIGGQGFCRCVDPDYAIFSLMKNLAPDFFVFNSDQIYADRDCPRGRGMAKHCRRFSER